MVSMQGQRKSATRKTGPKAYLMEREVMKLRKLLAATTVLAGASMVPGHAAIVDNPHFKVLGLVIVWGADGYEGTGTAPVVSDFIIDSGTGTSAATSGDTDLIGGDDVYTVVTGSLTPTSDSAASASAFDVFDGSNNEIASTSDAANFAKFDVTDATVAIDGGEIESSFYVASNVAFGIDGDADVATTDGDFTLNNIGFDMTVTRTGTDGSITFGDNAQFPHSAGADGGFDALTTLADIETAASVFRGDQRTAASRGTIASQSVRFDTTYTLGNWDGTSFTPGYDLSTGAGEIEANVTYTVFVP